MLLHRLWMSIRLRLRIWIRLRLRLRLRLPSWRMAVGLRIPGLGLFILLWLPVLRKIVRRLRLPVRRISRRGCTLRSVWVALRRAVAVLFANVLRR
jgi:hypothetical protein